MENTTKNFITQIEQGKFKNKNLFHALRGFELLEIGVNYGSSFLLPLVNYAATIGNVPLVILGASGLFSRGLISSSIAFLKQKVEQKYLKEFNKHTVEHKLNLLEKAKNIVTEEINLGDGAPKKERTLQQPEINDKLSTYISSYANKRDKVFSIYCAAGASILSIGGACVASIATGANPVQTLGTLMAGFTIGAANILYTSKKRKKITKESIELSSKSKLMENEILNKESLTPEDKEYKITKMKDTTEKHTKVNEKLDMLSISTNFVNNLIFALLIGSISFGNFEFFGNINVENVAQLVTMIYFYTDIGLKVWGGLDNLNSYVNIKQKYEQNLEIVKDIVEQVENKKDLLKTVDKDFSKLEIKDFDGTFYLQSQKNNEFAERALNIPNFCAETGKSVLVTGKSGSGKTTLFKWLKNGDINNSKGIILDEQNNIDYLGDSAILYATSMELSSDDTILRDITCGKNLNMLSLEEKNKLLSICKGLSLTKSDSSDPFSDMKYLKELENKSFSEFSQGQKQRLVLAKILYLLNPKHQVLIFDEPTANLDKETSQEVFKFITEFSNKDQKRIVILSSHETEIASQFADKTYEIVDGVLKEKEIITSNNKKVEEVSKTKNSIVLQKNADLELDER